MRRVVAHCPFSYSVASAQDAATDPEAALADLTPEQKALLEGLSKIEPVMVQRVSTSVTWLR